MPNAFERQHPNLAHVNDLIVAEEEAGRDPKTVEMSPEAFVAVLEEARHTITDLEPVGTIYGLELRLIAWPYYKVRVSE